jgi:hypothetical protein
MSRQLLKKWEKKEGRKTIYIYVFDKDIAVGSHYGNIQTDNAGWADIDAFKAGKFHPIILKYFNKEILDEVLDYLHSDLPGIDNKNKS